jgi:hypothetical protein
MDFRPSIITEFSFSMRPTGVLTGARRPFQYVATKPSRPLSSMVGRFGNCSLRLSLVNAIAFSVPAWMRWHRRLYPARLPDR